MIADVHYGIDFFGLIYANCVVVQAGVRRISAAGVHQHEQIGSVGRVIEVSQRPGLIITCRQTLSAGAKRSGAFECIVGGRQRVVERVLNGNCVAYGIIQVVVDGTEAVTVDVIQTEGAALKQIVIEISVELVSRARVT